MSEVPAELRRQWDEQGISAMGQHLLTRAATDSHIYEAVSSLPHVHHAFQLAPQAHDNLGVVDQLIEALILCARSYQAMADHATKLAELTPTRMLGITPTVVRGDPEDPSTWRTREGLPHVQGPGGVLVIPPSIDWDDIKQVQLP